MSTATPTASIETIQSLIHTLYGDAAAVQKAADALNTSRPVVVATYSNTEGTASRQLVASLSFANAAGAALSMIPSSRAAEATNAGEVPDTLFENFKEVLNILVNVFDETSGRMVLGDVQVRENGSELQSALESDAAVTLDVTIPKYSVGTLVIL